MINGIIIGVAVLAAILATVWNFWFRRWWATRRWVDVGTSPTGLKEAREMLRPFFPPDFRWGGKCEWVPAPILSKDWSGVKHAAAEIVVEAATHHLKLEAIEPIEASALAHGMWHLTKNGGDEAGAQAFADKTRPIIAARLGRKWP